MAGGFEVARAETDSLREESALTEPQRISRTLGNSRASWWAELWLSGLQGLGLMSLGYRVQASSAVACSSSLGLLGLGFQACSRTAGPWVGKPCRVEYEMRKQAACLASPQPRKKKNQKQHQENNQISGLRPSTNKKYKNRV